jgi:hypothetical protein
MLTELSQIIDLIKSIHPFRKLSDAQIEMVANRLKESSFNKDEVINQQNADAEYIYLILKGKVRLSRSIDDLEEEWGVLEVGDFLGYEMWIENNTYLMTAVALEDTSLLKFEWQALEELAEQIPLLQEYFLMMHRGFKQLPNTGLDWRSSQESVQFLCRTHSLFLWLHLLLPIAFGALSIPLLLFLFIFVYPQMQFLLILCSLCAIFTAAGLYWAYEEWLNDYFVITNRRVVSQKRVVMLYESRQESPLDAVLTVSSKSPGFWARRFGYGDVIIRTFTGTLFMGRIWHPEQVISLLEERLGRVSSSRTEIDKQLKIEKVRERLGMSTDGNTITDPSQQVDTPLPNKAPPSPILKLLSQMFQLRKQKDATITYRTHWHFLVKRVWVPTILFIGLLILPFIYFFSTSLPKLSFLGVLIPYLIAMFAIGGWWVYGYMDWENDAYILTEDQIMDVYRKPLGKEEKRSAQLKNIQSIEYKQKGLVSLLLNFGTVCIRIGDDEFTFDNVFDPSQVQRQIFSHLAKQKHEVQQAEASGDQNRILDWIEAYHQAMGEDDSQTTPPLTS